MGPLDRIRREWSEHKARLDAAHAVLEALTPKERQEVCAELCARVEIELLLSDAQPGTEGVPALGAPVVMESQEAESDAHVTEPVTDAELAAEPDFDAIALVETETEKKAAELEADSVIVTLEDGITTREVPAHLDDKSPRKTDLAEAMVWEYFSGVHASVVAIRIKQDARTAESTLRHVQRARGTIVRQSRGKWFPAPKGKWKRRKIPLHEAIVKVLSNGQPLGTAGIAHEVQSIRPDASYQSVAAEIMRMRKKGDLVSSGWSGRGALYELAAPSLIAPTATAPLTESVVFETTNISVAEGVNTPDDRPAKDVVLNGGAHTLHLP